MVSTTSYSGEPPGLHLRGSPFATTTRRFSTVPMGDDDENAESATLETVVPGRGMKI
jgi:hypothetical protein